MEKLNNKKNSFYTMASLRESSHVDYNYRFSPVESRNEKIYEKYRDFILDGNLKSIGLNLNTLIRLSLAKHEKSKRVSVDNFIVSVRESRDHNPEINEIEFIKQNIYYQNLLADCFGLHNSYVVGRDKMSSKDEEGNFSESDRLDLYFYFSQSEEVLSEYTSTLAASLCLNSSPGEKEIKMNTNTSLNDGELYGYPEEDIEAFKSNEYNLVKNILREQDYFIKLYTFRTSITPEKTRETLLREAEQKHEIVKDWDEDIAKFIESKYI